MDYEGLNSEQLISIRCLESSSRKSLESLITASGGLTPIKSNSPLMSFTALKASGNPVNFFILSMDINDTLLFFPYASTFIALSYKPPALKISSIQ